MPDGLGESQRHVDIDGLDGTAVCVDVVVLLTDMLSSDNSPDHRFTLLIANDLRVVVWSINAILFVAISAVGSREVGLRGCGSSRASSW